MNKCSLIAHRSKNFDVAIKDGIHYSMKRRQTPALRNGTSDGH